MADEISLKTYLEDKIETVFKMISQIIADKDRLYETRFKDSEIAVSAALAAQEKATTTAFLSSEKAIVKAEDAQKSYNTVHNDLGRKMDEQNKATMPRPETLGLFKSVDDKFAAMQKQVDDLRLSSATLEGKASQQAVNTVFIISVVSMIVGIISIFVKLYK